MGLLNAGGNENVRFLERERALLGRLGVFEICLFEMPSLS